MIDTIGELKTTSARDISRHCAFYREPLLRSAMIQIANTLLPYLVLCTVMIVAATNAIWWIVALLTVPAGGLLIRLFIIQHDCGHGSF